MSGLPPAGSRYAIYARYSTVHQHFKSIEDQIRLCEEYAVRQGWRKAGAFHDAERSGTTFEGRAGFFAMMAAADRGEFEVLVVEDLDRLTRQASGAHGLVEELEFLDIVICTVHSGPVSDMEVAFKAVQNASYVKNMAAKSRRGVEGTVKNGLQSGRVPYGYNKVFTPDGKNGQRQINPTEAPHVIRIMKDYAAGVSPLAICRALTAEGVPGPGGRPWRPGVIYGNKQAGTGILRNKLYIGVNQWGRTAVKRNRHKGTKVAKPVAASNWVRVEVPDLRIVDDELFEAVHARIEANENPQGFAERRRPEYLLTGLCYCGVCGSKYQVLQEKLGCTGRAMRDACDNRRRVARGDLEDAVLSGLKNRLLQTDLIEPFLAEYRGEIERAIAEQEGRARSSELRQKELERQIENILTQVRDGKLQGLAAQIMMQELDRLEAERQQLERLRKQPPRDTPLALDAPSVVGRLHKLVDDLREALKGADRDALRAREIIRSMVARVVIEPLQGDHHDGRGIGPVRVTIEGSLTTLLDLADQSRVVQHRSRPETLQSHASLTFKYYVDYYPIDSRLSPEWRRDLVTISQALDDAEAPVRRVDFVDALAKSNDAAPDYSFDGAMMRRAVSVVEYLLRRGKIRSIPARHFSGYVWNHIQLTDAAWTARAAKKTRPAQLPLPVIRLSPPDPNVVVIGRGQITAD